MIKLKIFCLFIIFLWWDAVIAQYRITGTVTSSRDSTALYNIQVSLQERQQSVTTDSFGHFEFVNVPDGHYTILISGRDYKPYHHSLSVKGRDKHLKISLMPDVLELEEVVIENKADIHMRGVESMGIYEGKKSEVIMPDNLVANLATNNARQVYSRVAGLNIWENDGAGLQLSIGGRGLDPNRTSNFNVRQNGYDISADALGYPESYYTPPVEAIERIQIVRGAASLQYGTQFGGLLNFVIRKPVKDKKIQAVIRNSIGSFGFYNSFTSLGGTVGKVGYYTFFQYKRGDGWRPNSQFENYNYYGHVNYQASRRTSIGIDLTLMNYLAKQPGGLTDDMFLKDPRQSNRDRNWFKVNWNMLAVHFNHQFDESNELNIRWFGLSASRYSLGFRPYRVATIDDNSGRDLIRGEFTNWGAEARYLKHYSLAKKDMVLLTGVRFYHGFNHSTQGQGSKGKDADFNYVPENLMTYDYRFPNQNVAVFAENIVYLSDRLSVTPGLRYENIFTTADGYYGSLLPDLAGNIYDVRRINERRTKGRHFILGGIGISFKPNRKVEAYANISQNYRSITFSDMRISNPSSDIDPDLEDERGYSADLGLRSGSNNKLVYDLSLFYMNYDNRIGEITTADNTRPYIRRRTNIGQAIMLGIESYLESDIIGFIAPGTKNWKGIIFINSAFIHSEYTKSRQSRVIGNEVEFVPEVNLKTGVRMEYKKWKASFQHTYLSDQFSDARNEKEGGAAAVAGIIPAYYIMDLSLSYEFKFFKIESSINNLTDHMYFTRRATGYPGPGILPSDGRSFYLTIQIKI